MKNKDRICAVCHLNYHYCPRCNEDKDKPLWYFTFCSSNCKDIYSVASDFENNQIDVNKAKEKLDKLDLTKLDNFGESYKKTINRIFAETKKDVDNETQNVDFSMNYVVNKKDAVAKSNENQFTEESVFRKPKNKRRKEVEE